MSFPARVVFSPKNDISLTLSVALPTESEPVPNGTLIYPFTSI